jgi:hypothetical protein
MTPEITVNNVIQPPGSRIQGTVIEAFDAPEIHGKGFILEQPDGSEKDVKASYIQDGQKALIERLCDQKENATVQVTRGGYSISPQRSLSFGLDTISEGSGSSHDSSKPPLMRSNTR